MSTTIFDGKPKGQTFVFRVGDSGSNTQRVASDESIAADSYGGTVTTVAFNSDKASIV